MKLAILLTTEKSRKTSGVFGFNVKFNICACGLFPAKFRTSLITKGLKDGPLDDISIFITKSNTILSIAVEVEARRATFNLRAYAVLASLYQHLERPSL
jgi:hypothetical protein